MMDQIIDQKIQAHLQNFSKLFSSLETNNISGQPLSFGDGVRSMMSKALETHKRDRKLIFVGNGGSAAIASHMAIDYWKNGGVRATCFNEASLLTCLSNDYGYEEVFAKPIEMFAQEGDMVIAISSSGKSPNILNAVKKAQDRKCYTVTLSGFSSDNPLRKKGDLNFFVPSPEYGFVEITHLIICHTVLDLLCSLKQKT